MGLIRRRRPPQRLAARRGAATVLALCGLASAGAAGAAEPADPATAALRVVGPPTHAPAVAPTAGPLGLGPPAPVPELSPPRAGPLPPPGGPREAARPARVDVQHRRPQAARAPAPPPTPSAPATLLRPRPATLAEAVARIPGTQAERARWVNRAYRGRWGAADWHSDTVYVSPRTPRARLYSVVVHEYSHLLQVRAYDGDVGAAVHAMNRRFAGTGLTGAERAADCMALLQGATWTNYTSCFHPEWREAATLLLQGRRV